MPRIDAEGVARHASILEVPDDYLECLCWGHSWDPRETVDWRDAHGRLVERTEAPCACTRVRIDHVDRNTGALVFRDWVGGHGFEAGAEVNRDEARRERSRRRRARAAQAA